MCKFSRTLYNRQLIQFALILGEFVVPFIRFQNHVKVITFFIAAYYLLLIGTLRFNDATATRTSKNNRFNWPNNNFARASSFLHISFPLLHDYGV